MLEKQFSNNRRAVVKFFYYLRTMKMEDGGKKYQSNNIMNIVRHYWKKQIDRSNTKETARDIILSVLRS
jgi:hypothetical protein